MNLPERPTWAVLQELARRGGLSPVGERVVGGLLTEAEAILGPEFPARTFDKRGNLPGELLLFATHRYVLPLFLSFALRLRRAAKEPTFRTVLSAAVAGVDIPAWSHLLLQLEAGRACEQLGHTVTYEPVIPGTDRKSDLLIDDGKSSWLVETTVVLRSDADKAWERYEELVWLQLRAIEHRHTVACIAQLDDHPSAARGDGTLDAATEDWLLAVEFAAERANATRTAQSVVTEHGRVNIYPDAAPEGTATFTGALQERDGWIRLRRTLAGKAKQIHGSVPAWLRLDCRDGLFQFGAWPKMPHADRVAVMADAIVNHVQWPGSAQGVVLSSGPGVSVSAIDGKLENFTTETDRGIVMRRLVTSHLLRETVIIPLAEAAWPAARQWQDAYGAEPGWLDADLATAGMPDLDQLWRSFPD